MKVVFFTKYSSLGASSRLRTLQYLDDFEKSLSCETQCLFSDSYIRALYGKRKISKVFYALKGYVSRILFFMKPIKVDLIVIEKELFPYLPSFFERWALSRGIPYIVDYDDAVFHNYDLSNNIIVQRLLGNKLSWLIKNSSACHVGNEYLGDYVRKKGAKNVIHVPTVIDDNKYAPFYNVESCNVSFVVGWIGSPSTSKYLEEVLPALKKLASTFDITLLTIGCDKDWSGFVKHVKLDWSEEKEIEYLSRIDVGIMPLVDEPWERGKCGYKLIQYMALGKPVVASPVGVNVNLVSPDVGYLCVNHEEWSAAIQELIEDKSVYLSKGERAREKVSLTFTMQTQKKTILESIKAAKGPPLAG